MIKLDNECLPIEHMSNGKVSWPCDL